LAELKNLMAYRKDQGIEEEFFGIGLTSRKNLCLNPVVSKEKKGKAVDSKCRNLTASWVRARAGKTNTEQQQAEGDDPMEVDNQVELCNFYEVKGFFFTAHLDYSIFFFFFA
jgi:DNA excision repair protein ERCC-2